MDHVELGAQLQVQMDDIDCSMERNNLEDQDMIVGHEMGWIDWDWIVGGDQDTIEVVDLQEVGHGMKIVQQHEKCDRLIEFVQEKHERVLIWKCWALEPSYSPNVEESMCVMIDFGCFEGLDYDIVWAMQGQVPEQN